MPRGTARTALLALVCCLAAGCTGAAERPGSSEDEGSAVEREYWPTDEWRTADPAEHGFDGDELAEIERFVREAYTNARSILIVRNGYLAESGTGTASTRTTDMSCAR